MLHIITSTGNELLSDVNIDDLEGLNDVIVIDDVTQH